MQAQKYCQTCYNVVAQGVVSDMTWVWEIKHSLEVTETSLQSGMSRSAFMTAIVAHQKIGEVVTHTITSSNP